MGHMGKHLYLYLYFNTKAIFKQSLQWRLEKVHVGSFFWIWYDFKLKYGMIFEMISGNAPCIT